MSSAAELVNRGLRRIDAPEQRPHTREHFADGKRLGDIVVGAQIEAVHAIALVRSRGEHQDRHGRALRRGTRRQIS